MRIKEERSYFFLEQSFFNFFTMPPLDWTIGLNKRTFHRFHEWKCLIHFEASSRIACNFAPPLKPSTPPEERPPV